jgi:hypothetical protein
MLRRALATALFCAIFVPTASAEPVCDQRFPQCAGPIAQRPGQAARAARFSRHTHIAHDATVVGRRPPGCPHSYCGCGLSLKIFGRIIPRLNLASNWIRYFPREGAPRAGLVAARRGHVMLLMEQVGNREWRVFDPNSGGGLTRVHVRSVAGHVFLNPTAAVAEAPAPRLVRHAKLSGRKSSVR